MSPLRRSPARRFGVLALVTALPLLFAGAQIGAADWPQSGGGPGHISASLDETVVDATTVKTLARRFSGSISSSRPVAAPVVAGGSVLLSVLDSPTDQSSGRVYAIDSSNGRSLWKAMLVGAPTAPAAADGRVFVATNSSGLSRVYGLAAGSGAQLWSTSLGPSASAPVAGDDGLLYVLTGETLHALGPADGTEAWQLPIVTPSVGGLSFSPPVLDEGVAFISWISSSATGSVPHVTAIDTGTHKRLWDRSGIGGGAMSGIGGALFVGGPGSTFRALDAATGGTYWTVTAAAPTGAAAVDLTDRTVVTTTDFGTVQARNTATGQLKWSVTTAGFINDTTSPPVIANGVVYAMGRVATTATRAVAFDEASGTLLWNDLPASSSFSATSGLALADGYLFAATDNLAAYSVPTGSFDAAVTATRSDGANGDLVYTLAVHNAGPAAAFDVPLTDSIPSGTTLVSAQSSQGRCAPATPARPVTLTSAANADGTVTLTWNQPTVNVGTITGYRIYRGEASGAETLLAAVGDVAGFTDHTSPAAVPTYYQVSAVNALGEGPRSSELRVVPTPASFAPYQRTPVGGAANPVAIGDVTGDGRNDIVTATGFSGDPTKDYRVVVLAQQPAGGFAAPVPYVAGGGHPASLSSLAVGDVTGDGRADVVTGESDTVEVFAQLPSGALDAGVPYAMPSGSFIRLGDVTGDGRLDVVGSGTVGFNEIDVRPGTATGHLGGVVAYPTTTPRKLDVGDLTGDGKADVAVYNGSGTVLLPQLPGGGLGPAVPVSTGGRDLTIGDVTGDGRNDLVEPYGGNKPSSMLGVEMQTGAGTLADRVSYTSQDLPEGVKVADVDRDGRADVVVLHAGWDLAGIYRQRANGTLAPEDTLPIPYASSYDPDSLAVGDVDSDGKPDMVIGSGDVLVLRNIAAKSSPGATVPQAPVLQPPSASGGGVSLAWDAPADGGAALLGYRIYRGQAGGAKTLLTAVGTATSFTDSSALLGTTYSYEVSAVNRVGESPRSGAQPAQGAHTFTVGCTLGQIASGGDATVSVVVRPTGAGQFTNQASLLVGDADGTNNTATTTHLGAAAATGARSLVFSNAAGDRRDLFAWNAAGAGPLNVTRSPAAEFAGDWSPDGTKLLFDAIVGGNDDLYVVNRDGTGLRRLTFSPATDENGTWSPDGQSIVFDSDRYFGTPLIYRMAADGTGVVRLTSGGEDLFPEYSPDGSRIAFISGRAGIGDVFVMNPDGSGLVDLTDDPGSEYFRPSWSPDGSRLAFASNRAGNFEIYTMNADGSGQSNLTNDVADDIEPAWSPDGAQIAFVSDRVGNAWNIYLASSDGSSFSPLPGTPPGPNSEPSWVPAVSVPLAPTAVVAEGGDRQAIVTFGPPEWDGGQLPVYYTVTASPGGQTAYGTAAPVVVNGLTNGVSYTFTVAATNRAGTGPASEPSAPVTPAGARRPETDPPAEVPRAAVPEVALPTGPRPPLPPAR